MKMQILHVARMVSGMYVTWLQKRGNAAIAGGSRDCFDFWPADEFQSSHVIEPPARDEGLSRHVEQQIDREEHRTRLN